MNIKYVLGAISLTIASLSAAVLLATSKTNLTEESGLLPDAYQEVSVVPPEAQSTAPEPETLITISDPFNINGGVVAAFEYRPDVGTTAIVGKSFKDVYSSELVLPAPSMFEGMGFRRGNVLTGEDMVVMTVYKFHQYTTVSWELGSDVPSTTGRWDDHPPMIEKNAAETLAVTYTSKDGGLTWVGSVS